MNQLKSSIDAGHKLVKDANLSSAASWLGCSLHAAPAALSTSLATSIHLHPRILQKRQRIIRRLRGAAPTLRTEWNARFARAAELETELRAFFLSRNSKGKEDLEADALAQLSFSGDWLKPLNQIPFMIALIAMFKIWVVPALTIATPIFAWILPYLLLKFVYAFPINQSEYTAILQTLWTGGGLPVPGQEPAALPSLSSFFTPKSLFQTALFVVSFLQSMIQPIQNARHLHKTDQTFQTLGKSALELRSILRSFREDLLGRFNPPELVKLSYSLEELPESDIRRSFLLLSEQPSRLEIALRDLANLEILWRIAEKRELQPVQFWRHELSLKGAIDVSLGAAAGAPAAAVPSSLELAFPTVDASGVEYPGISHAVVTGPNGGGKSSFLRAVLQSVLFGHAYGVAPAEAARMPRFKWVASGLQLRDTPGVLSMFETEVKFAADTLRRAAAGPASGPGLVLFDELFHSTNPPDGTRTARIFLQSLWSLPPGSLFSIVSTHVFPLVETASPAVVLPICCPAEELGGGQIRYSYAVKPGICKVSSVKKVWERFGLRRQAQARPRPTGSGQNLSSKEN